LTFQPLDRLHNLTRCRVSASGFLGEDQLTVYGDLEQAAGGLDETDLRIREGLLQLSRQTGSPGFVVSDNAVLNRHMHGATPCAENSLTAANRSGGRRRCQGDGRV
jgi:hypothetical protein